MFGDLIMIEKVVEMTRLNIQQIYELPFEEYLHYCRYIYEKVDYTNKQIEMKNRIKQSQRK